jgi:type VI secretion system protein ImpK
MSDDNPFLSSPTVIRPNPGGRRSAVSAPREPKAPSVPSALPGAALPATAELPGFGPLAAAAGLLLSLIGWVRQLPDHSDPAELRQRLLSELQLFDSAVLQAGQNELAVRQADYLLCATLDDVIANTSWGSQKEWSRQSLARTRHNDSTGGDQVFRLIEEYRRDPANSLPGLELAYFCLSLGFEGRFRIAHQGGTEHLKLRENILRLLKQHRGESVRALSPQWRGVPDAARRIAAFIPLWVPPAITIGLLGVIYAGLVLYLSQASGKVRDQMAKLPPAHMQAAIPSVAPQPPVEPEWVHRFLQREIDEKLVTVFDDGRNTIVRMVGTGMFASGSATLEVKFRPLIEDLARALQDTKGPILVTGHTDNQPIRFNPRFPSNRELSRARAKTVSDMLLALSPQIGSRISSEGRADTEPVDEHDTDSPTGRERNRRIDLIIPRQL